MVLKLFYLLGRSSLMSWVQYPGMRSNRVYAAPNLDKAASKTVFDNGRKLLTS